MKIEKLQELVERFSNAKKSGHLIDSSEATIRTWIDELLRIFDWNVQNTQQVLTEHTLGRFEREKLRQIGSHNIRPDYTFVNGKIPIAFLDAKSLSVDLESDKDAAFQIRSYGWSIGAPFSVVTNFDQLAIYDCSTMPHVEDPVSYGRLHYLTYDQFVDNFDYLQVFLSRDNLLAGNARLIQIKGERLDEHFSKILSKFRILLAKSIMENNDVKDINVLSFYVQTIINRILFIRVCEARGLERDGLLEQFATTDFWLEFKNCSYAQFHERYDGPMFRRIQPLHSLNIDNAIFESFVSQLYYPSPYRFDVIPLSTISDIYDLFLGYHLIIENGIVSDKLRSEFKKSNGAVTTPSSLVRQTIECTIPSSSLNDLSVSQLLTLNVVDIACGSGAFLIGAYDHFMESIERKLGADDGLDGKYKAFVNGSETLTLEGRKLVINKCLYGVDINPEAVEVAKLSLSLKLIDNYNPKDYDKVGMLGSQILKGVGSNIKCGNTLVGADIESLYPALSDNIKELHLTNAFDWQKTYPDVFKNGGFDYVIGNPPYVEVKNYNENLPHMAAYIKHKYTSSRNGKIDLSIPFIERGLSLLNDSGRLGYLVQKRFFKTEYGKGIRRLLTSRNLLNGIYEYSETDLFPGHITYVAILVCDNTVGHNTDIWYMNSKESKGQMIRSATLSETPWNFENASLNALRVRLSEKLGTLGDICNVKVGVQVLWNEAYQIKVDKIASGLIYGSTKIDSHVVVEEKACRPLVCNEKFYPLSKRSYSTYILFPYSINDQGEVKEIGFEEYCCRYPNAGGYLRKHKDLICRSVETLPQKNKKYSATDYWHLFTRANNHGAVYPKIGIPMTSQFTQASVILDRDVYCDNANMFFGQIENLDEVHLYALAAIINSTIFHNLARSIANPQQGGYYKFNKQFLDPVPFPTQAFREGGVRIKRLAKVAKQIELLNSQIQSGMGVQSSGLRLSLKNAWTEVDKICEKLYEISDVADKVLLYSNPRNDRTPYEQEN